MGFWLDRAGPWTSVGVCHAVWGPTLDPVADLPLCWRSLKVPAEEIKSADSGL